MVRKRPTLRWWLVRGSLLLASAVVAVAAWEALTWPDVEELASSNPTGTAFIARYVRREKRAGREVVLRWQWVPYARISPELKRAVLVAEDINFFSHNGFDTAEVKQAVREATEARRLPRGASTISQQTVKNLWLSPSRSPLRKLKEGLLTVQLEHHLTKRRILELYLNVAELGPGVYGAEAAARRYFGKSAGALTGEEAAQLAAGLPRPSTWHPGCTSRTYRKRVAVILRRMERAQWLAGEI